MSEPMWRTCDGREVAIREMSDSHLRNTARLLLRSAWRLHLDRAMALAALSNFCNGEMAQIAIDEDVEAHQEIPPEDFIRRRYTPIFRECARRKLNIEEEPQ